MAYVRGVDTPEVEVRRSRRRRRTVSAYREEGRTVVLIPARFTKAEERQWVAAMLDRLAAGDRRRSPSDEELTTRAEELSRRYLGGLAKPASIRWVDNQQSRWGSCTPADGTIRISTRVRGMPGYVLDYVVLHELAHLIVPGHGKDFWSLVGGFPRTDRARGYLEGIAAAAHLDLAQPVPGSGQAEEVTEQDGVAALEVGTVLDVNSGADSADSAE